MSRSKLALKLILLFILPLLGLGLTLTGLAGIAQAAPVPAAGVGESRQILPGTAPANIPLLQGAEADLSITKTNGQTETVPGESTTYTIIVTNLDLTTTVTGATVTDNFPGILTNVNWTCSSSDGGSCTASGSGDISDLNVNLPPGSSVTYVATGTVSASATGSLTNTATVAAPGGVTDPNTDNNSDTDADTLTPQANLSISKTNSQTSTIPGTSTTYTIVVSNSGPSDVQNATVSDDFPVELSSINWTCSSSDGGDCTANGSGNINDTAVDLPSGSSVTYVATGTVSAGATGSLTNTATVTVPGGVSDPNPNNNTDTDADTLTPQANLSISKTNGQAQTVPGTNTTYTIVISNSGPSDAPDTVVKDNFPLASSVNWTCTGADGGTCPGSGSSNISTTVNLPADSSVTFIATVAVNPSARGTLVNTATVTAPAGVTDPNTTNNSATDSDTLTPEADLRVTKADSPDPVIAGNILTYNITVFNDGPSDATGVTLVDDLPSGVTFQSSTPGSPTCTEVIGNVTCNLNTIAVGSSTPITIQVRVNPSTLGTLSNTAQVSGNEDDPNALNNSTTPIFTSVIVRTDLTIKKTDTPDPAGLGAPISYTLRITNNGPSNASGVMVTDTLPSTVSLQSAVSTLGSCSGTSTITCNLGNMASGGVATVTIVVNPLSTGTLNNVAVVSSTTTDPTPGNNSASATTTVNLVTDLAITNVDSPDPVTQGNNLTYNITVTNNGPSDATGVSMSNTLPAGVTFISAVASQGSCSGTTTITCNLGNLARNGSAGVTITVKTDPSTSGNISSTATASGGGGVDPNSTNNTATATTFVGILYKTYLPAILKDWPPTELSVFNDNTGANVIFTVQGTGVSCTVPNNTTQFCGSFPPGTYTVEVISACGNLTISKTYKGGPETTRIFCNN